jgi:putative heme iron utilization protein
MDMTVDERSDSELAQGLIEGATSAALATLAASGAPFASYVVTAPDIDLSPLLLLSRLAVHTKNLARDDRASLLFVREPGPGEESMTAARLTLTGRAHRHENADAMRLFLARQPDARRYAGFGDFSLYRFEADAGHLVAGFGRIVMLPAVSILRSPGN